MSHISANRRSVPGQSGSSARTAEHVRGAMVQARETDPRPSMEQQRRGGVLVPVQQSGADWS